MYRLLTPPPNAPYDWRFSLAPGPLSPAWPRAPEPELPEHELLELVAPLRALRKECFAALADKTPLLLGRDERVALLDVFERLRAVNAALPSHVRSSYIASWPSPALPEAALFGARDLVPLLGEAIGVADVAAERDRLHSGWARLPGGA